MTQQALLQRLSGWLDGGNPTPQVLREAATELRRLHAQVQELESRLEIDSGHPIDGIQARDSTIKAQDERIKELEEMLRREVQHSARKPLSLGSITTMACSIGGPVCDVLKIDELVSFTRAIERAHGIG